MNSRSQNTACGVKRIDAGVVVAGDKATGLRQSFCWRRAAGEAEPWAGGPRVEPFPQRRDARGAPSPPPGGADLGASAAPHASAPSPGSGRSLGRVLSL